MTPKKKPGAGKRWLVYAIMTALCAGFMWLIFRGSGDSEDVAGFNAAIPEPRGAGIVGSKRDAYEQEKIGARQRSLRDFSALLASESDEQRAAREARELAMIPKPTEDCEGYSPSVEGGVSQSAGAGLRARDAGLQAAAAAHAELAGAMNSVFEQPAAEISEPIAAHPRDEVAEQMALMERSYQLAAQYAGGLSGGVGGGVSRDREPVLPVVSVKQEVVSRLGGTVQSGGFYGSAEGGSAPVRNTISAVVYGDQTVCAGQGVRLRTVEAMRVGAVVVPAGTVVTGLCSVIGERLGVVVSSIEHNGIILPVELSAYDLDGVFGLLIPGSIELDAAKEIIGGMGQTAGTTISLGGRQSAGGQLLADLGRGVMQGTSQYVGKKARQIKVTLRDGYKVFLLPKNN